MKNPKIPKKFEEAQEREERDKEKLKGPRPYKRKFKNEKEE